VETGFSLYKRETERDFRRGRRKKEGATPLLDYPI
jgi:hypothetical protein